MNNNPYDTSQEWMNFHGQQTEDIRQQATHLYPLTPAYQREKIRTAPTTYVRRLSKSEALERPSYLKGFIIVATLLGFGTLGGLVANQMSSTNTTLNQTQTAPSMQAPARQDPLPSDSSDSGGFFKRHRGGYGFGQGDNSGSNAGNNSGAFSGSHTS